MFKCKLCSYQTNDKSNYNRHNKSKIHLKKLKVATDNKKRLEKNTETKNTQNITKRYKCPNCDNKYTLMKNLKRHYKTCEVLKLREEKTEMEIKLKTKNVKLKTKDDIIKNNNVKLKSKDDIIKSKDVIIQTKDDLIKQYKSQVKMYESIINCSSTLVKNSFMTINAIANKYANAPPLEMCNISDYGLPKDEQFYDNLLYDYKNGLIGKTLGDLIIKKHKKDNKELQSIWNTDSSRNTFFIKNKSKDENNESYWYIDKKGIVTSKNLIDPLVEHLTVVFQNKNDKMSKETNICSTNLYDNHIKKMQLIVKFIQALNDNVVTKKILSYVGPKLHLNSE